MGQKSAAQDIETYLRAKGLMEIVGRERAGEVFYLSHPESIISDT